MTMLEDRRKGALYGQAIGDALGAWYEFSGDLPAGQLAEYRNVHRGGEFKAGEFTDDTSQALILARAFTEEGDDEELTAQLIAEGFQNWLQKDGRGCGNLTSYVLTDLAFAAAPVAVAEERWINGGRTGAPNGGVMRSVGAAIVRPWDRNWTIKAAMLGCKVTHADPRCVASCVALNVALRYLLLEEGFGTALMEGYKAAVHIEPGIKEFLTSESGLLGGGPIRRLKLGESGKVGYTYKCVGAAFWALQEFHRDPSLGLHEILSRVIRAGGDTDTNAAVAGALIGASIGFSKIPKELVDPLIRVDELDAVLAALPQKG